MESFTEYKRKNVIIIPQDNNRLYQISGGKVMDTIFTASIEDKSKSEPNYGEKPLANPQTASESSEPTLAKLTVNALIQLAHILEDIARNPNGTQDQGAV